MTFHALFAGVGSIGSRHLKHLLELVPDATISVLHSRKRELAEIEKRANAKVFYHIEEALAPVPDAVFICNPTGMHMPIALAAAKAGCALFIEKPISATEEGIDELMNICKEKRLTTFVAYCLRFHPDIQKIKEMLNSGRIGRPISASLFCGSYLPAWNKNRAYQNDFRTRTTDGGGVLLDLSHEIDYARLLFGEPAVITALTAKISDLRMDAEDCADLLLRFTQGPQVSIHLNYFQKPPRRGCEIRGTEGTLIWNFQDATITIDRADEQERIDCVPIRDGKDMYKEELAHFLSCLREDKSTSIPLEEGAKTLQIILEAKQKAAIKSGNQVTP